MEKYIDVFKNHRSLRKFSDKPVEKEQLDLLVECAQHAATSEFIQAYTVINVTDQKVKQQFFDQVTAQKPILEAPVFLMFCGDANRLNRACRMNKKSMPEKFLGYTESFLMISMDVAIVAQALMSTAELCGIGGTYIGGIRNNPAKVVELLKLPCGVFPLFGMVLGYPSGETDEPVKPRLPLSVILKENVYDTSDDEEALRIYDQTIKSYYIERTNGVRSETWTEQMTDFVAESQRPFLKEFLKEQGFLLK